MKLLSRDFTLPEKILLFVLCVVLLGLAYYQFVDKPIRKDLAAAAENKEALELEYATIEQRIARLTEMRNEVEEIMGSGSASLMPSYNNYREELNLLNDILKDVEDYTVSFSNVTRDGDQIRRGFTLQFTAPNYKEVQNILTKLSDGPFRCLLGDVRCGTVVRHYRDTDVTKISYSVNASGTFYETMVGGVEDSGLPADRAAAK